MYKFYFEKTDVWQKSRVLSKKIYEITKSFPKSELFGLTSQIRRCVISVPSNIAEGLSRSSNKEQARFTEIAYSSLMELLCQLILSNDLCYISEEELKHLRLKISEISNKLNSLKKTQLSRK